MKTSNLKLMDKSAKILLEDCWGSASFLVEMKPRVEHASLFVDCARGEEANLPSGKTQNLDDRMRKVNICDDDKGKNGKKEEPVGFVKLSEHCIEIAYGELAAGGSKGSAASADDDENCKEQQQQIPCTSSSSKLCAKFADILLDARTISAVGWADAKCKLLMCKVKAEAYFGAFAPKTLAQLEQELAQHHCTRDYVQRFERRQRAFNVQCAQCAQTLHSHAIGEFEFGVLPTDDWLDTSPQLDYFCGLSGSECCGAQLDRLSSSPSSSSSSCSMGTSQQNANGGGILGISAKFSTDSARHWLPTERKIVFSNSFLLLDAELSELDKRVKVKGLANENDGHLVPTERHLVYCAQCNAQLGTRLKNYPSILKLHLCVLNVFGDGPQRSCYVLNRFHSMNAFLAWMLLNKCEQQSSAKLLVRSLDKTAHLLIWLLEPYVLLTKGVLHSADAPAENSSTPENSENSNSENSVSSSTVSFPALKVLYKCFDAHSSKEDPRANGADSSVGILDAPLGCCLQLTELLLASSLALPPPVRALGQFYVGFIRLKDRVD